MHYITIAQTLGGFLKLALSIGLLYLGMELTIVFWTLTISNLVLYFIYLWTIRYVFSVTRLSFDKNKARSMLGMAGTFMVISIFGVVFKQVDVLMLGRLRDPESVGIYSAAFRLIQIGMQLLPPLMLSLFPRMSEVFVEAPGQLGSIAERVLRLLLVFILPVGVISTIFARRILFLFYGPGYEQSVIILRILIWVLLLFSINAVLYRTMIASDNEQVTMRVAGVNMIISILFNLYFIPRWGATGVTMISLLTTLIAVVQNYEYIPRHLFQIKWLQLIGKPAVAACLSGGLLFALHFWSPFLGLVLAMGLYSGLIVIFKVFPNEDIRLVQRASRESKARIW
jgi:O-antigen/teichoic acid export membrane protein